MNLDDLKRTTEKYKEIGVELSPYGALMKLLEEAPHPKSNHLSEELVALLPKAQQQAVKDAKTRRERRLSQRAARENKKKAKET